MQSSPMSIQELKEIMVNDHKEQFNEMPRKIDMETIDRYAHAIFQRFTAPKLEALECKHELDKANYKQCVKCGQFCLYITPAREVVLVSRG